MREIPCTRIAAASSALTRNWVKRSRARKGGAAMPEFVRSLGPEEARTIDQLVRSRTVPAGIFQRALIVKWSSEGLTPSEIAHRLPMKWDNVVKWIRRF